MQQRSLGRLINLSDGGQKLPGDGTSAPFPASIPAPRPRSPSAGCSDLRIEPRRTDLHKKVEHIIDKRKVLGQETWYV